MVSHAAIRGVGGAIIAIVILWFLHHVYISKIEMIPHTSNTALTQIPADVFQLPSTEVSQPYDKSSLFCHSCSSVAVGATGCHTSSHPCICCVNAVLGSSGGKMNANERTSQTAISLSLSVPLSESVCDSPIPARSLPLLIVIAFAGAPAFK